MAVLPIRTIGAKSASESADLLTTPLSMNLSAPSGRQNGDRLLAVVTCRFSAEPNTSTVDIDTPAGWTLVEDGHDSNPGTSARSGIRMKVFERAAGPDDFPCTITTTVTGGGTTAASAALTGFVMAFKGSVPQVDVQAVDGSASSTTTTPTYTATADPEGGASLMIMAAGGLVPTLSPGNEYGMSVLHTTSTNGDVTLWSGVVVTEGSTEAASINAAQWDVVNTSVRWASVLLTFDPPPPPVIPTLEVDPGNVAPRYANQPAFQVRRQVYDGDFVRGPGGWKAFIRYGARFPEGLETSLLVSQPEGYDSIKIWWGIPPEALKDTWTYMALVRSGFGHPTTPTDGEVIVGLDGNRPDDEVPGVVIDSGLPQGQWFYYTLMFRVGTRWYPINYTQQVVNIDYRHRDALYDQTPPFYQEVDAERFAGTQSSMLERWFYTIGYDLDLTRTLTEGIDRIYDADRSPLPMLQPLGEQNLGLTRSEPLGDIRYRGVVAQSQNILAKRGTYGGLKTFIEAATQYDAYVSPGLNLMLLDDDARFAKGKGNWSPSHFGLNTALIDLYDPPGISPITSRQLTFETGPAGITPEGILPYPPELSQSILPVTTCTKVQAGAAASEHLVMACGVGQQITVEARDRYTTLGVSSVVANYPTSEGRASGARVLTREKVFRLTHLNPLYRGVVVDEGESYYFSFWMCAGEGSTEDYRVNYGFAFYPRDLPNVGFSDAFNSAGINSYHQIEPLSIDVVKAAAVQNTDQDQWRRYVLSSVVPEGARFAVPVIWVTGLNGEKISTPRYLTAAMVNKSQGVAAGALFRPDYYFRVTENDANYLIGEASNKVLGEA